MKPLTLRHRNRPVRHVVDRRQFFFTDSDGKRWVDLSGGNLVQTLCNLGSFHPAIRDLWYLPSYGATTWEICQLEERIVRELGGAYDQLIWASSGSDVIDCALQTVRSRRRAEGRRDDALMAVFPGSFHGNTLATSCLATRPGKIKNLIGQCGVALVLNDAGSRFHPDDGLERHLAQDRIAAVVIEPLATTGRRFGYTEEFLESVVKYFQGRGVPVIFDEIACGCYRRSYFSFSVRLEAKPEFVALAKGLSSGITPISLLALNSSALGAAAGSCELGHTFGITPFAAAAVTWVLDRYRELEKASLPMLSARLAGFAAGFSSNRAFVVESAGNVARVRFLDAGQAAAFDRFLAERGVMLYQSTAWENDRVFVVAPSYDMDITALADVLGSLSAELKTYLE